MQSPNEEKITLFRAIFKGREDIYPVRWENQKGKSGYSPPCIHEWDRKYCKKPVIKCGECENRSFASLDGKRISIYAVSSSAGGDRGHSRREFSF